jgi:hypothetical protein
MTDTPHEEASPPTPHHAPPLPPAGAPLAAPQGPLQTALPAALTHADPRPPGAVEGAWPARKEPVRRPVDPAEVAWWKAHTIPAG